MASLTDWVEGARPRTLPAAVSPVVVGTGAAAFADGFVWWKALLALVVSLALQVGVNYANDYSDGIRCTDDNRVGPFRLTGSRAATPHEVRRAAFGAFGVAGVAGLILVATHQQWWLLLIGVACVLAAWYYTGGSRPYGYAGLGEVSVFVFFGLVAVLGTTYVQVGSFTWASLAAGVGIGALACAILVANNLRDIPSDAASGKRTLAVVVGAEQARGLYGALVALAIVALVWLVAMTPWALLGLVAVLPGARAVRTVSSRATGLALIPALRDTGLTELAWAVGVAVGLALAGS